MSDMSSIVNMTRATTATNFTATANFGNALPHGAEALAQKVVASEYADAVLTITETEVTVDLGTDRLAEAVLRMAAFGIWANSNQSRSRRL